jgi:hypothetical protein
VLKIFSIIVAILSSIVWGAVSVFDLINIFGRGFEVVPILYYVVFPVFMLILSVFGIVLYIKSNFDEKYVSIFLLTIISIFPYLIFYSGGV